MKQFRRADAAVHIAERVTHRNKHSIGLPCTLGEIALTPDDVPAIAHKAASVVEWKYVPGNPTEDAFINAILATDKAGKEVRYCG